MSKRRTTSIGDGIGADQRAQWRKALAASKRQQRQRRGRKQDTPSYQPGMARISPAPAHDGDVNTSARCPVRGCFVVYRGGDDRLCPIHQDHDAELAARTAEIGAAMAAPGETSTEDHHHRFIWKQTPTDHPGPPTTLHDK